MRAMRVTRARHEERIPVDPREWRPQVPLITRRAPTIPDPIIEPLWSGTRVIVHFQAAEPSADEDPKAWEDDAPPRMLLLIDVDGNDLSDAEPAVTSDLGRSILAIDAVIDGILSSQATRGGEGAAIIAQPKVSRGSIFMPRDAGLEVERKDQGPEGTTAFVALDLLQVDGQSLLDLPLLERKRLLDGLVVERELVRVTPFTRPPLDPWVASWKGAGFRGAMMKAANGRYAPGGYADDWTPVTRLHQRR
jgi:hypothetical protein